MHYNSLLLSLLDVEGRVIAGICLSIFMHELGHVVAARITSVPASGFSMGIFSFGWAYYWPSDRAWGFLHGKFLRPKKYKYYPHVYSFPIPSTGWERILKSAGGPIGSLISAVIGGTCLIMWFGVVHPNFWNWSYLSFDFTDNAFFVAFTAVGIGGTLNVIPLRGRAKVVRWLFRLLPVVPSAMIESWLHKQLRRRLLSDGDRIWSGVVRSIRGRVWRGKGRMPGSYYEGKLADEAARYRDAAIREGNV